VFSGISGMSYSCSFMIADSFIRLLDVISTSTHSVIASIHLETPEDRGPSDIASSSKAPLRLSPFWQWKGLHSTCKEEVRAIYIFS